MIVSNTLFLISRSLLDSVAENLETVDYLKEGDVGFKKPKVSSLSSLISSTSNHPTRGTD